jgi:hypothetical protein
MSAFGYLLGLLYKLLHKKAEENVVWWAWGPFVGFYAMKAEEGFMEITTWIVKSLVVMFVIIFITNKFGQEQRK